MLSFPILAAVAVAQATPSSPTPYLGSGSPAQPAQPITAKDIGDIEAIVVARTFPFKPNGAYQWPDVELADLRCVPMRPTRVACAYRFHAKPFGKDAFGAWIVRKKVFDYLASGWVMLNGEEWCDEAAPNARPDYCFPDNAFRP